jgi:hypothetical protein
MYVRLTSTLNLIERSHTCKQIQTLASCCAQQPKTPANLVAMNPCDHVSIQTDPPDFDSQAQHR